MRIVSLLPGATEALFALGLGPDVVGVTHECDHPADAATLPRVTRSSLQLDGCDSRGVDEAVGQAVASGLELYAVHLEAIRALEPDLVVAQDVCDVCAVPADQVERQLSGVRFLRQHPHSFEDVLAGLEELATVCGADPRPLVRGLRDRIQAVAASSSSRPRHRGVFLEWLDPPYPAGHWTPDLLDLAGIDDPLARAGVPSAPVGWEDVAKARPELLILSPCGFDQARAEREAMTMSEEIREVGARRVAIFDGSAYFNRPGPRLVDSLELLSQVAALL